MKKAQTDHFRQNGFISKVVLIIVALAIVSYFFKWNIVEWVHGDQFQTIYSYIKKLFSILWSDYLARPAIYIWNEIIIDIGWNFVSRVIDTIKNWIDARG